MSSRSRVKPVLAIFAIAGLAFGAAGAANATTEPPGTEPADTEPAGTEPAGTEPAGTEPAGTEPAGTEPAGTEPAGEEAGPGPGAGSGSDSGIADADLAGTEVTVFGVETSDAEAGALQAALDVFAEANDMTIEYVGLRDFEAQIGTQVSGGNPPDIAIFPQPGRLAGFARSGDLLPLPDDIVESVSANWEGSWMSFGNVDGTQFGVPNKSDLKSLVWYVPSAFEAQGYEVPETLDDFYALTEQMLENGDTPLCVGIESAGATGWPFTDWVEDLILRRHGIDFYNQWVNHEVPFDSPEVVEVMQEVVDLWNTEDMVFAAGGSIVSTNFGDNGQPLVDGDCMMHRQASFFAAFFPEGTTFGSDEGQVDTFYFPSNEGQPVLVAGTIAAAFRDAPEVWAVMEYFGSPEFADARQESQAGFAEEGANSGFLSANLGADLGLYTELEQTFIEILQTGSPAAFDGSDQMPGEVGSGTFWSESTSLVNGDVTAEEAAAAIEASWPAAGAEEAPATTTG
jgi:alpha-glucoside transport system substrate-binding protein